MAERVEAEMVANVWKVVVTAGQAVSVGDTLVILESMKMEIPVLSELDGTVVQIAVNEGDVVQEGDLIVEVDREPVRNLSDFNARIRDAERGSAVLLRIVREERSFFVSLRS